MPESERGGGNLQVMRPDHLPARFQVRPDARMAAGLVEIKGLHEHGSKNLFHLLLTPSAAGRVLRPLSAVKEFGCNHGGNQRLRGGKLAQETLQIKFAALGAIKIEVSRINPMRI